MSTETFFHKSATLPRLVFSFILLAGICLSSDAAENLTKFLSPRADAILFFSNLNTEKKIDKDLWKTIQKDSREAAEADADEADGEDDDEEEDEGMNVISLLLERFHDRNAQAVFNLYVLSLVEPSVVVEGVAEISGNLSNDLENIAKQNKSLKKVQAGSTQTYQIESESGLTVRMLLASANVMHFRIDLNFRNPLPLRPYKAVTPAAVLPADLNIQDHMIVFNCHPEKVAKLLPATPKKTAEFREIMQHYANILVAVRVDGKQMKFKVVGECADGESAAKYFGNVKSKVDETLADAPTALISNLNVSTSDRKLLIEADLNMETMWGVMKTLVSQQNEE